MKLLLDENLSPRLADRAQSDVIREFSASVEEGLLVLELFPRQD